MRRKANPLAHARGGEGRQAGGRRAGSGQMIVGRKLEALFIPFSLFLRSPLKTPAPRALLESFSPLREEPSPFPAALALPVLPSPYLETPASGLEISTSVQTCSLTLKYKQPSQTRTPHSPNTSKSTHNMVRSFVAPLCSPHVGHSFLTRLADLAHASRPTFD